MRIRVMEKTQEGDKLRFSPFEGTVLAIKHGRGVTATMTVRNIVAGIGVEKVYPLHSPLIKKVEILQTPKKFRRAKLYYLRGVSRKEARRKLGATQTTETQKT